MALPTHPASSWRQNLDLPSQLFGTGTDDYELYEEDGEFVLTVEMPGFDPEEITVAWNDGALNIAAEHTDDHRNQRRTYHRRFRFPKAIDDAGIAATYNNGILEIRLPVSTDTVVEGREIEVET